MDDTEHLKDLFESNRDYRKVVFLMFLIKKRCGIIEQLWISKN